MYDIPANFPKGDKKYTCVCGESENIANIYNCGILSKEKLEKNSYENIYNVNMNQQIKVYQLVRQNLKERKLINIQMNFPCDPDVIRCNQYWINI